MKSLAICIPTFQRNDQLAVLLPAVGDQTRPPADDVSVRVFVIDNNPDGRARQVVEALGGAVSGLGISYLHVTEPGVTHVRNRALAATINDDYLAFIDDDELPDDGWLARLWSHAQSSNADVVFGTVEARYEGAPADWIVEGDFHSKRINESGRREHPGATDNCLIKLSMVRAHDLSFDPALSLVGGEDTLFFEAMSQRGAVFYNAADARTFEYVPENRGNLEWLMTRWRRTGLTDGLMISRRRGGGRTARCRAFGDGVLRCALAGPLALGAWLVGGAKPNADMARFMYTFQRGRGMIDFARGRSVSEYGRSNQAIP